MPDNRTNAEREAAYNAGEDPCASCKHTACPEDQYPCSSCDFFDLWEEEEVS